VSTKRIEKTVEEIQRTLEKKHDREVSSKEIGEAVMKHLHELDEIADDTNLQAYTRTQIWNVVSILETL
jgi:transcriptional regulator NrdR family protein